jgi:hypothetical protein
MPPDSTNPLVNPTPSPGSPQPSETVRSLVGEFLDEKRRETTDSSLVDPRGRARTALLVVALITCAIVWILPSLYKPPVETPSPQRVEAGTRMTLFLASERVRSYRHSHGALPATLAEAGVDSTGLTYQRANDSTFEVTGQSGGQIITYRSNMNNSAFLGDALQILSTGR